MISWSSFFVTLCLVVLLFSGCWSGKTIFTFGVTFKSICMRPDLNRVPEFYHNYINQVKEDDLATAFANQTPALINFLGSIPEEKYDYAYAPGKWTIKEVL